MLRRFGTARGAWAVAHAKREGEFASVWRPSAIDGRGAACCVPAGRSQDTVGEWEILTILEAASFQDGV